MKDMSPMDLVMCGIVGLYFMERVFRLLGWERGAYIADELQDALQDAKEMIMAARVGGELMNIDRAAEAAASKIKGMNADDVRPIVAGLVERAQDNRYGVSVKLDSSGNVSVDPSGAVGKLAGKAGKWLRKVF